MNALDQLDQLDVAPDDDGVTVRPGATIPAVQPSQPRSANSNGAVNPLAVTTPSPASTPPASVAAAAPAVNALAFGAAPPRTRPSLLQAAVNGFQRGYDPAAFDKQQQQNAFDVKDVATKSMSWLQQLSQIPVEQRSAFQIKNAAQISADTHVPQDRVISSASDPNELSDAAIGQNISALKGHLGMMNPVEQPYTLNPGDIRAAGNKVLLTNPKPEPQRQTARDVNGVDRYVDSGQPVFDGVQKATPQMTPYEAESLKLRRMEIDNKQASGAPDVSQFGDMSKTGDDYLKSLQPNIASQVKALSEGRLPLPSSMALKSPYWQGMLQATAQYDPSFDQANAGSRSATRKDFTSGKAAQNITSFNTLLGHLQTLQESSDKLDNGNFVPLNQVGNVWAKQNGDPRIDNFNAAKHAVIGELVRAFRGVAGSEHDIKEWENALNASQSPKQTKAVIAQMTELLGSRIESLGNQYSAGMGRSVDGINLLDPKAQTAYYNLLGVPPPESAVGGPDKAGADAGAAPPPAAPAAAPQQRPQAAWTGAASPQAANHGNFGYNPPAPAQRAPAPAQAAPQGGITVRAPDGSMHAFPNQQAADAFRQAAGIR